MIFPEILKIMFGHGALAKPPYTSDSLLTICRWRPL